MKAPIDRFKGKSREEIYEKEKLLDKENLDKNDQLAMFLAAMKVFLPWLLLILSPLIIFALLLWARSSAICRGFCYAQNKEV